MWRRAAKKLFVFVCGLFCLFVLLEAGLFIFGFARDRARHKANRARMERADACKVVCFGESVTATGYPRALEHVLNEQYPVARFSVANEGRSSTSSDYIREIFADKLDEYLPRAVVIMTGINDDGDWRLFDGYALGRDELPWFYRLRSLRLFLFLEPVVRGAVSALWERGRAQSAPAPAPPRGTALAQECWAGVRAQIARGRLREAAREYENAARLNPGKTDILRDYKLLVCDIYMPLGDFGESAALLDRVLAAADPGRNSVDIMCALNMKLYIMGRSGAFGRMRALVDDWCLRLPESAGALREMLEFKMIEFRRLDLAAMSAGTLSSSAVHFLLAAGRAGPLKAKLRKRLQLLAAEQGQDPPLSFLRLKAQLLSGLAVACLHCGEREDARKYYGQADAVRARTVCPQTARNVRYLARAAIERGVLPVFVQYPMRDTAPLEKILAPFGDSVLIVGCRDEFRAAVADKGFDWCFSDSFAWDFGHLMRAGQNMLAQKIARAIGERLS